MFAMRNLGRVGYAAIGSSDTHVRTYVTRDDLEQMNMKDLREVIAKHQLHDVKGRKKSDLVDQVRSKRDPSRRFRMHCSMRIAHQRTNCI